MVSTEHHILLVGNGPGLNRGCAAITLGTLKIIRRALGQTSFVAVDHGGKPASPPVDPDIIQHSINVSRWSRAWFVQNTMRVLGVGTTWFPVVGGYIANTDAVLALGGDNYSMDYGSLRVHLAHMDYALAHEKPFVIWGGSVGPFDRRGPEYERYVATKLQRVAAILAREDATVEYLASIGVVDNVRRVADPAFVMDPVEPRSDAIPFEVPAGAIGLNFSSLMARYTTQGDVSACVGLVAAIVRKVVNTFERPVVLVPHSLKAPSDDYVFLDQVSRAMAAMDASVLLLPRTLNAPEIKWVIGRLACFAGSRMHSTIASLSSAVPTLSFAYSIKSIGLNWDIFGHQNYLLSPSDITPDAVVSAVGELLRDEDHIRHYLEGKLPSVREAAYKAGTYLKDILQNGAMKPSDV